MATPLFRTRHLPAAAALFLLAECAGTPGGRVASKAPAPDPESLLADGDAALERDELPEAARAYRRAAEASDDEAVAEQAAQAAFDNSQYGEALLAAERWLALNPTSEQARRIAGVSALELHRLEAADTHLAPLLGTRFVSPAAGFLALLPVLADHGSMFAWQFSKAQHTAQSHGWTRFASMQDHYNLVYREEEREMIPLCIDQGVGLIPWSPMARGFFAKNRTRDGGGDTARAKADPFAKQLYFREEDFKVADIANEIADARGVTGSQVARAWVLSKPHIASPIIGATKLEHLEEAIAALDIKLSEDEVGRLEDLYKPHLILGHS